jgi:hypothetical protein
LPFSVPEWQLLRTIEEIPGSTGTTGNFATGETGGGVTLNGTDPRCLQPIILCLPAVGAPRFAKDGGIAPAKLAPVAGAASLNAPGH